MQTQLPLAERMRPKSLNDYVGQTKLVGKGSFLRRAIDDGFVPSMILWGPPGVGKTSLAQVIANTLKQSFFTLSAISSGVKDVREVIEKAKKQTFFNQGRPILFIDEIHRFSKSQQDSLLGAVEQGVVTLIGATTENPSFEVISALLSRCQVYVLEELTKDELVFLINEAIEKDEILKTKKVDLQENEALLRVSGGDARKLYNALDIIIEAAGDKDVVINNEIVLEIAQKNISRYDKGGEQHYDVISAFIKSIRGSDPNAAVYWLARMIEGGEDPKFIARRLLISASEDVGLANPTALVMATNAFQAVQMIGFPECEIILSQATVYLATSPKSNASYMAIKKAKSFVKETGNLSVPLHLRNAPTKLMKELNYGEEYKYAHDFPGNFVKQDYLPLEIKGQKFYEPGKNKREEELRNFLNVRWQEKYGY